MKGDVLKIDLSAPDAVSHISNLIDKVDNNGAIPAQQEEVAPSKSAAAADRTAPGASVNTPGNVVDAGVKVIEDKEAPKNGPMYKTSNGTEFESELVPVFAAWTQSGAEIHPDFLDENPTFKLA